MNLKLVPKPETGGITFYESDIILKIEFWIENHSVVSPSLWQSFYKHKKRRTYKKSVTISGQKQIDFYLKICNLAPVSR